VRLPQIGFPWSLIFTFEKIPVKIVPIERERDNSVFCKNWGFSVHIQNPQFLRREAEKKEKEEEERREVEKSP
jgi:hypothetical protein